MQDFTELSLGQPPGCMSDDRPCAAVCHFCDSMVAACDLARKVAGAVPDLHGTFAPEACRFGLACTVHWQVHGGKLHLSRDGLPLRTIHMRLQ